MKLSQHASHILLEDLVALAEKVFTITVDLQSRHFDRAEFANASADYCDAIAEQIHEIVKENGLHEEYYRLTENTILESLADEWLEKNPFNPEAYSM